ncbi:MAG: hypothetical protein ACI8Z1_000233 [Candidatus Azotimanducaceae bacterium]
MVISFLFFFLMPGINPINDEHINADNLIDIQSDVEEVQLKKFITLARENPTKTLQPVMGQPLRSHVFDATGVRDMP